MDIRGKGKPGNFSFSCFSGKCLKEIIKHRLDFKQNDKKEIKILITSNVHLLKIFFPNGLIFFYDKGECLIDRGENIGVSF